MYIKFVTILIPSGTPLQDVTPLGSLTPIVNGSVLGVANTDTTSKGILAYYYWNKITPHISK